MHGSGGGEYKSAKFFKEQFDITSQALLRWCNAGKIRGIQIHGGGGHHRYHRGDVEQYIGCCDGGRRRGMRVLYARVSSAKQKEDLHRQVEDLKQAYPNHDLVITDIGSGVNFERRGSKALLERVCQGLVAEVVVMHKDRLGRIGTEIFQQVFEQFGTRLVVHCQDEENDSDKHDDLIAIITLFVASHHGKRAAENRKRRAEEARRSAKSVSECNAKVPRRHGESLDDDGGHAITGKV